MRGPGRWHLQRPPNGIGDLVIANLARRARPEPVQPLFGKAATPLAHCVRVRLDLGTDRLVLQTCRRSQHDPGPPCHRLARLVSPRQRLQLPPLSRAQRNRHRRLAHHHLLDRPCDRRNFAIRTREADTGWLATAAAGWQPVLRCPRPCSPPATKRGRRRPRSLPTLPPAARSGGKITLPHVVRQRPRAPPAAPPGRRGRRYSRPCAAAPRPAHPRSSPGGVPCADGSAIRARRPSPYR